MVATEGWRARDTGHSPLLLTPRVVAEGLVGHPPPELTRFHVVVLEGHRPRTVVPTDDVQSQPPAYAFSAHDWSDPQRRQRSPISGEPVDEREADRRCLPSVRVRTPCQVSGASQLRV